MERTKFTLLAHEGKALEKVQREGLRGADLDAAFAMFPKNGGAYRALEKMKQGYSLHHIGVADYALNSQIYEAAKVGGTATTEKDHGPAPTAPSVPIDDVEAQCREWDVLYDQAADQAGKPDQLKPDDEKKRPANLETKPAPDTTLDDTEAQCAEWDQIYDDAAAQKKEEK